MEKIVLPDIANLHQLDVYKEIGGYQAVKKAYALSPDDIIDQVKKSGLRGRGGAAFSAG
ncbi:MAG: NADH-quinone oxidoreductase subunit F, partial [Ignavibacteriaceae bacterium]|nr:NADH-quinone oxidoreductase subunit F [Ignavibacteriaceae bacterium]